MNRMEKINTLRGEGRLTGRELVHELVDDFVELKGDRLYGEDSAIYGGIGTILGIPVTIIAQDKGATFEERVANNFGMAHPEGYRKAMRLMESAEKFKRPIITIVDTAGAYPGIESEERGQASSIANSLFLLSDIKVPVITIILSEGGSGGALALAHSDFIYCFENAYYSVISPEGYAEILYKSQKTVEEIIDDLPIFAEDLLELEIIDQILPEPEKGLSSPFEQINRYKFQEDIVSKIKQLDNKNLLANRYARFRKYGK